MLYKMDGAAERCDMMNFDPAALLVIAVALVLVAILNSASRRREDDRSLPHTCAGCGTVHPPHANYCRRCGRKL